VISALWDETLDRLKSFRERQLRPSQFMKARIVLASIVRGAMSASRMKPRQFPVKKVPSEEQIRTRLRELTEQTRKVREELMQMIDRAEPSPTRRFLHQSSFSRAVIAADRRAKRPQKHGKKR
jgi:hypothetical protein